MMQTGWHCTMPTGLHVTMRSDFQTNWLANWPALTMYGLY